MADPAWTHRTAVVFIPPAEVWPPIQAIRRVHDRQVQRWMPHITLLYPFAPRYELPGLAPALEAACAGLSPFEATLDTFQVFQHRADRSTVWLAPEPREAFAFALAALLVVPLVGCGSAARIVRLDTGQGEPLVLTPHTGHEPVRLRQNELKEAMSQLARDVPPASSPLRNARRLIFGTPWQEEVYLRWTGQQLVLEPPGSESANAACVTDETTLAYGRWCEHSKRSRDCLSLLKDGPVLTADGRYTLAMEFALGSVWLETMDAFKDMAHPEVIRSTIVSAMALYMMLWVLPEPTSKGIAATLTVGLMAYLGVDTVWSLIRGWMRLVDEVNQATSFAKLREAGERFGKVMGQNSARIFIMLATAAIGNTVGLATKGPGLPGSPQAAVLAPSQGGFRFMSMGDVKSVAVSSEGVFTIALAPGAVAMTAQGMTPGAPGPVEIAGHEHHIATNKVGRRYPQWRPLDAEVQGNLRPGGHVIGRPRQQGPHLRPQGPTPSGVSRGDLRAIGSCDIRMPHRSAMPAVARRGAREIGPGNLHTGLPTQQARDAEQMT